MSSGSDFYRGGINRVSLSVSLSKKDTRAVTSSRGVIPSA